MHGNVLWIRRDAKLASVLTAAVVRQRAKKLSGRGDEYLQRCVAARACCLDA